MIQGSKTTCLSKIIFVFQELFFHKCKLCKLIYCKNYFNHMKIFVLGLFKMAANHSALGLSRAKNKTKIETSTVTLPEN